MKTKNNRKDLIAAIATGSTAAIHRAAVTPYAVWIYTGNTYRNAATGETVQAGTLEGHINSRGIAFNVCLPDNGRTGVTNPNSKVE